MTIYLTNLFAFGTLFSSVFAITSQNPVISVIFVIVTFVNAAGYLILLGINFLGLSYIVIYVGAIAVLFLFIIMMINVKLTDILETGPQYTKNLPLALAIGSVFIYVIFTIIPFNYNNLPAFSILIDHILNINRVFSQIEVITITIDFTKPYVTDLINLVVNLYSNPSFSDVVIFNFTQIQVLGHALYTYGAILLITLSVILLLAMVATIIISRSKK